MTGLFVHFVLGVGAVLGLLWLASKGARRLPGRGGGAAGGLRVVARRQLGKGSAVVRVGVEDKDLLLGCSPQGIELLCELPATAPEPDPAPAPALLPDLNRAPDFAAVLSQALGLRRRQ